MGEYIVKDGIKYYGFKKLAPPRRDDFFVATGEVEWGGGYQDTGYIDDSAYRKAQDIHSNSFSKECKNRAGYYCKNTKCQYPKCLTDKTNG